MPNSNKAASVEYKVEIENLRRKLREKDELIKKLEESLEDYIQVTDSPEERYKYINIYLDKESGEYESIFYENKADAILDLESDSFHESPIRCIQSLRWIPNVLIQTVDLEKQVDKYIKYSEEDIEHELIESNLLKIA